MGNDASYLDLNQAHSSYFVLATLAGLSLLGLILYQLGPLSWVLGLVGRSLRGSIRGGFFLWRVLFGWATWPIFLGVILGLLGVGWGFANLWPGLTLACAGLVLCMGVTACLAFMFIDLERYEVERGYKAVHNPLKGQELATHLARYGHQVGVPLLAAASLGVIGGFALLNEGLYNTVGHDWYVVENGDRGASYIDFLAHALVHLYRIVDVFDLASSRRLLRVTFVRQVAWPSSMLLTVYKTFFTLVLLQQVFASIRQGRLLAETIADFWSPHEPIHERARAALPQFGASAMGPLLVSLRDVATLTKEQRDQMPPILSAIGPSAIPTLVSHLSDPHEHVRAVAASALGHLHAYETIPLLTALRQDSSDIVRLGVVEALGTMCAGGAATAPLLPAVGKDAISERKKILWWRRPTLPPTVDPIRQSVDALESTLKDASAAVRSHSALALGKLGEAAASVAPALIRLLDDSDETVRCCAAESLGSVGGDQRERATALVLHLEDPSPSVKTAACRALGSLPQAADISVPALVGLLHDREESVREAAASAITRIGPLDGENAAPLVEGLASPDSAVRAQAAEALGSVGAPAEEVAPALVDVLKDTNDAVRARAVEALGRMGEAAAEVAVPGLMRALRDRDSWVSALAAEALGQMGEAADEAVPALIRSLQHVNPRVRANAAEALGRLGDIAEDARSALETAIGDDDGAVRAQIVRALGSLAPRSASQQIVRDALEDGDPLVRAAGVETLGRWGTCDRGTEQALLLLLSDANDDVKVQTARVLPRLVGPKDAILEGLCRRLREDDGVAVQASAAQALGKLGSAAACAGPELLRAAQTGSVEVREEAMRALVHIQPAEALAAFATGLKDASPAIRRIASAGWMRAPSIPEEILPDLVASLRDPEEQIRANIAHALARLDSLPAEAVPLLIECLNDSSDGLRMNAAAALERSEAGIQAVQCLLCDGNIRLRLIAARAVLQTTPGHVEAEAVLMEALNDPTPRVREAAEALSELLRQKGVVVSVPGES